MSAGGREGDTRGGEKKERTEGQKKIKLESEVWEEILYAQKDDQQGKFGKKMQGLRLFYFYFKGNAGTSRGGAWKNLRGDGGQLEDSVGHGIPVSAAGQEARG